LTRNPEAFFPARSAAKITVEQKKVSPLVSDWRSGQVHRRSADKAGLHCQV
jgi:hypothetical protein